MIKYFIIILFLNLFIINIFIFFMNLKKFINKFLIKSLFLFNLFFNMILCSKFLTLIFRLDILNHLFKFINIIILKIINKLYSFFINTILIKILFMISIFFKRILNFFSISINILTLSLFKKIFTRKKFSRKTSFFYRFHYNYLFFNF